MRQTRRRRGPTRDEAGRTAYDDGRCDVERTVDETGLQLVHLLQIAPRASWAGLAPILGLSPSALAARWRRLEESGTAWLTVHADQAVTGHVTAIVRLECRPGSRVAVREACVADPRVVGIDESSTGSELLLTVMVGDLHGLTAVLGDLESWRGVQRLRSFVVHDVMRGGSDWRLGNLDAEQVSAAEALAPDGDASSSRPAVPGGAGALAALLTRDARMPIADLARGVGATAATTRRHLDRLVASGALAFRCDLAHDAADWPVTSAWFVRVPPSDLARTVTLLSTLTQLRLMLGVMGEVNLVFSVFGRSVSGVAAFEETLGRRLPWLEHVESLLLLRSVKRMGWVLDEQGRRTDRLVVPAVLDRLG